MDDREKSDAEEAVVKCGECGWSGPRHRLERKLHCDLCPRCRVVLIHTSKQLRITVRSAP